MQELAVLSENISGLPARIDEIRRDVMKKAGEEIKQEVDWEISDSGMYDRHGKVRRWQRIYIGSGGGYAAVRSSDEESGENSPGAITNYLENGHIIRGRSGKNLGKNLGKARAFRFYKAAQKNGIPDIQNRARAELKRRICEATEGIGK